MEDLRISIIIPVYNVEKYLAKCLDSILVGNAFTGQVICVNDGSTDGSAAILEEYAQKYPNVGIITQPNAGLSAARNAGIKAAKGEYVCFLDSDDYWDENVLGGLMEQIERDQLDVLRFKYQNVRIKNEGVNELKNEWEYEVFNPYKRDYRLENDYSDSVTDGVSFLNSRMNTQCYAVMFIVKRSLLIKNEGVNELKKEGCLFTEGIYFEDTDWTPRMLCKAKRVASTGTIVYNYLMREGSITKAIDRVKQQKVLHDKIRLLREMQRQAETLRQSGRNNKWYNRMITDIVVSIIGILSSDFYAAKCDYLKQLKSAKIYPISNTSLKAILINLSPRLAVELLHLKNGHRK